MSPTFFTRNRQALLETVGGPIVVTGFCSLQRKGDAVFRFEQDASFWYLTGINEPDWWAILTNESHILVAPQLSETQRLFEGGISLETARQLSGVDRIITPAEGRELLTTLAERYDTVSTIGRDPHTRFYGFSLNPAPERLRRRLKNMFSSVSDCRLPINRLRAIKQPEEIVMIQRAIDITVEAFNSIKPALSSLQYEYEVEAAFTSTFRTSGAQGHAYEPIIAMGKNACTLHYSSNQEPLHDGLLLLDVGAQVGGYAADITRTYQRGTTTDRQLAVHAAVRSAHSEIIALLRPGLSVAAYHEQVDTIMHKALESLDLLKEPSDYRRYFPHAISHGLGIDAHDPLGMPTEFQEGMVLTVEPGIYISEESIGVRIEDDIVITKDGSRTLSASLPTGV